MNQEAKKYRKCYTTLTSVIDYRNRRCDPAPFPNARAYEMFMVEFIRDDSMHPVDVDDMKDELVNWVAMSRIEKIEKLIELNRS